MMLEFFATDEAVSVLEATLDTAVGDERLQALVAVAWQMRQRDSQRAVALVKEARATLPQSSLLSAEQLRLTARLDLIDAEAQWLVGEIDASKALAENALRCFESSVVMSSDLLGCADAHWLLAWLALDVGDGIRRDAGLEAMATASAELDPIRLTVAQAALARSAAFRDPAAAKEKWGKQFSSASSGLHPAAACWVEDFWSIVFGRGSDYVESIRHGNAAYTLALASGQPRRAIIGATNIGAIFGNLNDYQSALDWMQRGLDLARRSGWPIRIGGALMQTAEALRCLQRFDAAAELLQEALTLMAPLSTSRDYAIALRYLANVELDRKQYPKALDSFRLLEQRALALEQPDLVCDSLRGQATALCELDQPEAALHAAESAIARAGSDATRKISALQAMADIHIHHSLPAPPGVIAANPALHCLEQALDIATTTEHYEVPGELLEAVARQYAAMGQSDKAFELAMRAIAAHKQINSTEANNRASAMQVSHETEKARAESEHQKQLAQAHADRAAALERAIATLERLGAMGREMTSSLDVSVIVTTLSTHVQAMLGATGILIYRLEPDGKALKMVSGVEAGEILPAHWKKLDDVTSEIARCARDRREILSNAQKAIESSTVGAEASDSSMFAPLLISDTLIGAMAIHSEVPNAFGEREVAIFRTLCAYASIALANADAQAQLLERNKALHKISVSDRLTGLYNRLHLDQVLNEELARGERTGAELSVILLDVDHFKSVNDTHGHLVGDQVLMAIAEILKTGARKVDVVGRWGGEEFLVVCRETSLEGAAVLAEKLRGLIEGHTFPVVGRKTGSFGVANLGEKKDINALIASADAALYEAKNSGRNRVQVGR